jgi:hypothetical protein
MREQIRAMEVRKEVEAQKLLVRYFFRRTVATM